MNQLMRKQRRNLPLRFIVPIGFGLTLLTGCTQVTNVATKTPPLAQVGDGQLDLTLATSNKHAMVEGSKLVITLLNHRPSANGQPIAGDIFVLNQTDQQVRVSIPLDKRSVKVCSRNSDCTIEVVAYKNGTAVYRTKKPYHYHTKTKHLSIRLNPADSSS